MYNSQVQQLKASIYMYRRHISPLALLAFTCYAMKVPCPCRPSQAKIAVKLGCFVFCHLSRPKSPPKSAPPKLQGHHCITTECGKKGSFPGPKRRELATIVHFLVPWLSSQPATNIFYSYPQIVNFPDFLVLQLWQI